ncbi:hypothetical protein SEA_CLARK_65 [Gordonia phage Clark]|uniref:Uncharacterized protein n=5 Tax=Caudoviricetes TaxID=2731619 RepID=A0A0U4JD37_9CAUD|nr:hypothetical protein PP502_gp60 [Gordonia phage Beenie]YP_010654460.1 hypothetical protein PP507_gp65 [Gordonia phage Clark]YP_010654539.1 hypothetical protein PP508_gp66 [Gordonia phage Samman98]YP_010654769.1 hypothetical protein PP511_gp60 [Gordonia phage Suerte]YP_010654927.1 hypothetical protein PP513_gp66 [Gordonia phage Howe]AZF93251.1 hypothetical protein SEA_ADORA_63 [Gordonia phage Adora]QDF16846.1 hypothetical protein SEA_TWINKLE_65 [Gordonia phage Twinkle]QYC54465.1 hypothetic
MAEYYVELSNRVVGPFATQGEAIEEQQRIRAATTRRRMRTRIVTVDTDGTRAADDPWTLPGGGP